MAKETQRRSNPKKSTALGANAAERRAARSLGDGAVAELLSLLDGLDFGIAQATRGGKCLYANPRFAEILGNPGKRAAGKNLWEFVSPAGWGALREALERGAKGSAEGELTVAGEDVPSRTIRLLFSPLSKTADTTVGIVASEVTELVEATKALKQTEASLHSLSTRLLQVQDEERRRIARDLHDITGQELAVAVMSLDGLRKNLDTPKADIEKAIQDSTGMLRKVEGQIRTLSYVLHPPLLDEMGIASALLWYVDGFSKRTKIRLEADIPKDLPRFPIEKETALFRVIQECLTNVFRHSGGTWARVRLSTNASGIEASVEDDGKGFDSELLKTSRRAGVGIQSMRGRLELVGGELDLHSGSKGTRVTATVPLQEGESMPKGTPAPEPNRSGQLVLIPTAVDVRKRILIADDHEVSRRGIRMLLSEEPDMEICGEATDGVEAVAKTRELSPDLVIMDLSMPKMGGLSAANRIRGAGVATKILIYTSHTYYELEKTARAAGCDGFVSKSNASHDLIRATRVVLQGGSFYSTRKAQATTA